MKVCIIGAGPSGLFLAKYLSPHVESVSIFEKDKSIGGMYKYSQHPKFGVFKNILNMKNVHLIKNFEINTENFGEVENQFDKFVLATGGVPNHNPESGFINAIDVITKKISLDNLRSDICIIGMGNVSIDLVKLLLNKARRIDVCSRKSLFDSKFGNAEMRDLIDTEDLKINLINSDLILNGNLSNHDRRRYEMFNKSQNSSSKVVNLRFNTEIKDVKKINGKYILKFNSGDEIAYDSVISSFGFKPNKINLETRKPVYRIGWCEKSKGNINDALFAAKQLASKILA
ncbi:hypothetical protein P3W45_000076 [Vairimorpha bombi]|jgi:pyruvate/2-oxoglutarate dehydrogenase complex dihydrolipoamide dehydrogenase (E3) component